MIQHFIVAFAKKYNINVGIIFNRMKSYGGESDDSDTEFPDVDVDKLQPLEISPDEHKLQYTYCLWYHRGSYKLKTPMVKKSFVCQRFWSKPILFIYIILFGL